MKLLLKLKTWIVKTFTSVKKELKVIVPIAISVVNGIKSFVDSSGADFLTSVIPGELDDSIKITLRAVLPSILKGLKKWEGIISIQDENEQLKAIVSEIKLLTKSERDNLKTQIAAELVVELSERTKDSVLLVDAKILTLTAYNYPEVLTDEKAI